MVTFRLVEENKNHLLYWYFPEGNEEKEHGTITVNRQNNEIKITKLAEIDFSRTISIEEQNEMHNSINQMRIEEGKEELSEVELPIAVKPIIHTFYADHAISKIVESYNNGNILKSGTAIWY